MNNQETNTSAQAPFPWFVYIISCNDKSLYTGITTDIARRMEEHNSTTKGARYTRSRRPVELVYFEKAATRAIATRRELQIKKLPLPSKKQLIKTCPPAKLKKAARKPGS